MRLGPLTFLCWILSARVVGFVRARKPEGRGGFNLIVFLYPLPFWLRLAFIKTVSQLSNKTSIFKPRQLLLVKNSLPSKTNIPIRSLDKILHYFFLQKTYHGKYPHFLFEYYISFLLKWCLKDSALCLLQTKYATKPRNPE